MSEHTPGRLEVSVQVFDNEGCPETVIQGMSGAASVAVCLDFGPNNPRMREANARRLVACWNALEDIPQAALDGGWTRAGLEAYGLQMKAESDSLRAVNAELLEASKNALDILTTDRQSFVDCNQLRDCRTDDPIAHGLVLVQEDVWITPDDAEVLRDYDRALLLLDAAISSARKQGEQG